jgi:hypothetical protein
MSTGTAKRKIRGDIRIGALEKKLGLAPGAIRNPDGSKARSDKKLDTLRKEYHADPRVQRVLKKIGEK